MEERVQKILSQAGFGSRRACEEIIADGRVRVNGQIISLGDKADPGRDKITVDGQPVKAGGKLVYIALNKPRNVLSTVTAPDPRPTVRSLVDVPENIYPVGRLDVDSEGLILLTNDGVLANMLTHPRYEHEKEYKVLVARHPDEEQLALWRRGVVLEDGHRTAPAEVRVEGLSGKGAWLRVVLKEGRKRQIREIGSQIGLPVVRIIRVRIGSLQLGSLKPRDWRHLSEAEVAELKGETAPPPEPKRSSARPIRRSQARTNRRPSQSHRGSAASAEGRSQNRQGKPTEKTGRKPRAGSPIEKPGRHPGSKPAGKSRASTKKPSGPKQSGVPSQRTERRPPRGQSGRGKRGGGV